MKKWAYEPGETMTTKENQIERFRSIVQKHSELVESHLANTKSAKTAVMSDGHEIVYFANLDEDFVKQSVDVAVYNGTRFIYLPDYLAEKLADQYFDYVDAMNKVLEYMEDGGDIH